MNVAIRAVVRSAEFMGMEFIGIRRGWNGLINGDIMRMDEEAAAHIINRSEMLKRKNNCSPGAATVSWQPF